MIAMLIGIIAAVLVGARWFNGCRHVCRALTVAAIFLALLDIHDGHAAGIPLLLPLMVAIWLPRTLWRRHYRRLGYIH